MIVLRKFRFIVNGVEYIVTGEEITGEEETAGQSDKPATAPVASKAAQTGEPVKSPIQGTVVGVSGQAGSRVARGDCVCKLEAMKMEYDIVAPRDGVIASIDVTRGSTVSEGQTLFTLADRQ